MDVADHHEPLANLAVEGKDRLKQIQGIGDDLAAKIIQLVTTGSLPMLDELKAQVPESVLALIKIPGVGPITALTWALEIGDVSRFQSVKQAVSYCGLCSAERSSADKLVRMPISKQRLRGAAAA